MTKRWDELSPSDGFSAQERGNVGQFGFYPMYLLDASGKWIGSWSANSNALHLTRTEINEIYNLQAPDECSVAVKMGWLVYDGVAATPIWGGNWQTATDFKAASLVYAGQPVTVLEEREFPITFGGVKQTWLMSRIRTHSKDFPVYQYVTVVDKYNRFGMRPKGLIKMPLYGEHYPFYGTFKPATCWIPNRWLNK